MKQTFGSAIHVQVYFAISLLLCSQMLFVSDVRATTWYVRTDGGDLTQCNGLVDQSYSGSGTNQPCAYNHLFQLLKPNGLGALGGTSVLHSGDTVIISPGSYMMGIGAPNTSQCNTAWAYGCTFPPIPSGIGPNRPTRIFGKNWDNKTTSKPELWGFGRADQIINLSNSNYIDIRYIELTDHSSCIYNSPDPIKKCDDSSPYDKPHARTGIYASDSTSVYLKDISIHGLSIGGIRAGKISDWLIEGVHIRGNGFYGWNGDIGVNKSANSGTINFLNSRIEYSGCGEKYPSGEIYGCYSQSQGGYGDGLGSHRTGGTWVFDNVEISHNTSDGLDLLYHNGDGKIIIQRSRFEGNAGNAVKVASDTKIENSILVSNCEYFNDNMQAEHGGWNGYKNISRFDNCRAGGTALVTAGWKPGHFVSLTNSIVIGTSTILIEASGDGCDGSERFVSRNSIFVGMEGWFKKTHGEPGIKSNLFYLDGIDGNGSGPCGPSNKATSLKFDNRNSIDFNTRYPSCSVSNNILCTNPLLTQIPPLSGASPIFTYGERWNVKPQISSPAVGRTSLLPGASILPDILVPSADFDGTLRGVNLVDWGPYQVR